MLSKWRRLDQRITTWLVAWEKYPLARQTAAIWAHSGDSVLWLTGGVLLWHAGHSFWATAGQHIVLATACTWVVCTALKYIFRRPRPAGDAEGFYLKLDKLAFPSGHATRAGSLVVALGVLLPQWARVGLVLWSVGMSASRVMLRLHYFSDVTIGFGVGLLCGAALIGILG